MQRQSWFAGVGVGWGREAKLLQMRVREQEFQTRVGETLEDVCKLWPKSGVAGQETVDGF